MWVGNWLGEHSEGTGDPLWWAMLISSQLLAAKLLLVHTGTDSQACMWTQILTWNTTIEMVVEEELDGLWLLDKKESWWCRDLLWEIYSRLGWTLHFWWSKWVCRSMKCVKRKGKRELDMFYILKMVKLWKSVLLRDLCAICRTKHYS